MTAAKVQYEVLSDRSVAWNVEYRDGHINLIIGCVDRNAAELMAKCLNDASWVHANLSETVGSR